MNCLKTQVGDLYGLLAQSKAVDEAIFPNLIKIFKRQKIQDCLEFLSQDQNQWQVEKERQDEQMVEVGKYNIKTITDVLKKLQDHKFNQQNYSRENYKEIKKDLIIKISLDKKITKFIKFLVHLTAFDERYIQCGSNSLHLLVQMKVDLKESCFENIKIRNTSLIGANLVRCDLSGSEFENVIISGVNLNQAKLFNCKWRNLGINEGIEMNGHADIVNQVCFSPDEKSLASCSDDNYVILWDVKTEKRKYVLQGKRQVKSVCFSSNGTALASCSGTFVYVWNLRTGKQILKLDGSSKAMISICYSSDGTTLASCSSDRSILFWDVKTGQQKIVLDSHSDDVRSVCFTPDGTTLASGSGDNSIRFWDVSTAQKILFSDNFQKDTQAQFQSSTIINNGLPQSATSIITVLRISQNPNFDAQGALILNGEFVNHQSLNLKSFFKFKGSLILENYTELKQE
ncbi:unnamed protein product [Paramecium octaurelia]|uniref:Uncharacterized protein n=1 Tax=Paramecium octaurelia TaxID=43137 RepID=A0A8S1YP09_PAROT|nr:unnamed protein product [Paramecium octaurelia]